jgi:hypothetical protein
VLDMRLQASPAGCTLQRPLANGMVVIVDHR